MKRKILLLFSFIFILLIVGCSNNSTTKEPTVPDEPTILPTEPTVPDEPTVLPTEPTVPDEPTVDVPTVEDYGELVIPKLTIYTDFPDKPNPTFTKEEYACEINYNVLYSPIVTYSDGYFYASGEGSAMVEATTKYHSTVFIVEAISYLCDRGESQTKAFLNRIAKVEEKWQEEKVTGGTLYIGDSFFDEYQFFTNFYKLYENQNAYCHGISSSRIEDWYIFSKRLVYPVNPSNIVLHIGTNDLFSGKEDPYNMLAEMKVLFNQFFERIPNVNLYWFAIEPRTYGINGGAFDSYSYEKICLINDLMKDYCNTDERLHYVEVLEHCYLSEGVTNANFFSDGVHPKVDNYIYYCEALIAAGLDLPITKPETTTKSISFEVDSTVSSAATTVRKDNVVLTNNYSIKGTIKITKTGSNPHLEFDLDGSHFNNRFLIWDKNSDGVFTLGYALDKTHHSDVNELRFNINDEFEFEIVTTNNHSYLYINGNLELIFRNVNSKKFTISSANAEALVSDISIVTSTDLEWNEILSRTEINTEEINTSSIKEVIIK